MKTTDIIQALDDRGLLRPALGNQVESWKSWRCYHKVVHGLPLDEPGEMELFTKCTGLTAAPLTSASEVMAIIGRRGGKSIAVAIEGIYTCLIADFWKPYLAPGERGYFVIIATDKQQCRVIMDYVKGIIAGNKFFASMVENETQEEITFKNNSSIMIKSANYRTIRGYTLIGVAMDELAFWRDNETSANPASEILDAIRPGVIPGGIIFGISSAYAKQGLLFDEWQQHYGQAGDTLIWVADTRTMNPLFDQKKIDKALQRDSSVARAEYFSIFRDDLQSLFSRVAIEAAIIPGRQELPPAAGLRYYAFCDPSGGRHDSFTLAISHKEKEKIIIDLAREVKAPFQPAAVVREFAADLRRYNLNEVTGDKYSGSWVSESFASEKINYNESEKTASELYLEMIPRLSNAEIELPENQRLFNQLCSLLRRTGQGGKDSVICPQGSDSHADIANSVAGACFGAAEGGSGPVGEIQLAYHQCLD
jgi:hypothetical protein